VLNHLVVVASADMEVEHFPILFASHYSLHLSASREKTGSYAYQVSARFRPRS
jgi:hypothetical protein